ncbi:hypothetical protein GF356_06420 [candidate division GN15 bacterium]|nr:hypothetical protein [candidate division GN15 bacterium]
MRIQFLLILAALLVAGAVTADEEGHVCPAHLAAEQGHNAFAEMHHVIAPAWHDAWPNKNYDALIEFAPKFEATYQGVAEMKPDLKIEARQERFEKRRTLLGDLVTQYAEAAKKGDKEKVYALMPDLHEAFEQAAASLVPIEYPEFEGVDITSAMILDEHIPAENYEGVVGSTETLLTQLEVLTAESVPSDLSYFKEDIVKRFEKMRERAAKMKECCDNNDMDLYKEHAMAFRAAVTSFQADYL